MVLLAKIFKILGSIFCHCVKYITCFARGKKMFNFSVLSFLHWVNLHRSTYVVFICVMLLGLLLVWISNISLHNLLIYCREYLAFARSWGLAKIRFALGNFVQLTLYEKGVAPFLCQFGIRTAVSCCWLSRLAHCFLSQASAS